VNQNSKNPPFIIIFSTTFTPPVAYATALTSSTHVGSIASTLNPNITPSPYTNLGGMH